MTGLCDDRLILKLVLQPIVENAIYHGIKEKKAGAYCDQRHGGGWLANHQNRG